jgi:hypothetical protein
MRVRFGSVLAASAILALALPVWARSLNVTLDLMNSATIAGKQLKPGHYRFVANPKASDVKVYRNYKLIAMVPGHWVNKPSKSPYTDVVLTKRQISELDFAGKTQAIRFR